MLMRKAPRGSKPFETHCQKKVGRRYVVGRQDTVFGRRLAAFGMVALLLAMMQVGPAATTASPVAYRPAVPAAQAPIDPPTSRIARRLATPVSPGEDCAVQTAVNDANVGDELVLDDGTYTCDSTAGTGGGHVLDVTKRITIRARNQGKAILDGESISRVVRIVAPGCLGSDDMCTTGCTGIVLDGLVVTNGADPTGSYDFDGAGMLISADSTSGCTTAVDVTLRNLVIHSNRAARVGGGVCVITPLTGTPALTVNMDNCEIHSKYVLPSLRAQTSPLPCPAQRHATERSHPCRTWWQLRCHERWGHQGPCRHDRGERRRTHIHSHQLPHPS